MRTLCVLESFKYTIRLVDCEELKMLDKYVVVPDVSLLIKIVDASHSYTTPATYSCNVVSSSTSYAGAGEEVFMISHRIRYTELDEGVLLRVQGPLYVTNNYKLVNLDIAKVRLIS